MMPKMTAGALNTATIVGRRRYMYNMNPKLMERARRRGVVLISINPTIATIVVLMPSFSIFFIIFFYTYGMKDNLNKFPPTNPKKW